MKSSQKIYLNRKINHLIFIDIETVATSCCYENLTEDMRSLWDMKSRFLSLSANGQPANPSQLYKLKAGVYSEFSKVLCISIAESYEQNNKMYWDSRSFYGDDEATFLAEFADHLSKSCPKPSQVKMIGHNIREFDIPFLIRRMLIHGVQLPKVFNIRGKKPWQIEHLVDTMNLWKFGDFKNYTSLNLLAKILNVPSSKESLDGSKIHDAYWMERNLESIVKYCESDVWTTSQVYFKLMQKPFPKSEKLTNNLLKSIN